MEQVREEEDASRLQFGPGESVIKVYTNKKEFDAAGMLSTSEVAYLFQTRQAKGDASTFTPVFNATLTYTQTFSKLKTKAAIQESRKYTLVCSSLTVTRLLLEHPSLTAFERAQLINCA